MIRLFSETYQTFKVTPNPRISPTHPDLDSASDPDPEWGCGGLFQEATHDIFSKMIVFKY
jgi:hypothetical protein